MKNSNIQQKPINILSYLNTSDDSEDELFDINFIRQLLGNYRKSVIKKTKLSHIKLLHALFCLMIEEGRPIKIKGCNNDSPMSLAPQSATLCMYYNEGLEKNLKGAELLNYAKENTIDFFDNLKAYVESTYAKR